MRDRDFFKWVGVRNEKKSLKYEKSGKHCYILTSFAAATLGWLSLKSDLGHFKNIMRKVLLRINFEMTQFFSMWRYSLEK